MVALPPADPFHAVVNTEPVSLSLVNKFDGLTDQEISRLLLEGKFSIKYSTGKVLQIKEFPEIYDALIASIKALHAFNLPCPSSSDMPLE